MTTLTTDTYWEIDGVPLQTLAYNVSTWGGTLQSPPPLRGEDLTIPYRPGTVFQPRRPNGRTITFEMWVQGSDTDGNVPTNHTIRQEFEHNFAKLRNLFWNQGKQVTLTKRWRDYATGTIVSATAKAVYAGGIAPSMTGAHRATFTVDMYLSDPFFYSTEQTVNFSPAGETINKTITVAGDYETTACIIEFDGARNNFRLTNLDAAIYVNVALNLASGSEVRLDVDKWTARRNPNTDNANVIGAVTHFGHEFWFALAPGEQDLSLTSGSGTGTATLKYRPRWL